jgi:hypothetical protein
MGKVYIPVQYSVYPLDDTPVQFGPRPRIRLPLEALNFAISGLNTYITKTAEPFALLGQGVLTNIIDAAGQVVGFYEAAPPLYYYHDAIPRNARPGKDIAFPYSSQDIDDAIHTRRLPSENEENIRIKKLADAALARNRLYRLFLAEFSAVLRSDKNTKLRTSLETAIMSTKFDSASSMTALRTMLGSLLGPYPEDLLAIRDVIVRALEEGVEPKKLILQSISNSSFAFDRRTLTKLRSLVTHSEVVAALHVLMDPRILAVENKASPPPNQAQHIFVSCSEVSSIPSGQCSGRRLVVPADRIDDFFDILAADVRNPGKGGLLSALSAGVFDPLDFQRHPGEHLVVTLGAK